MRWVFSHIEMHALHRMLFSHHTGHVINIGKPQRWQEVVWGWRFSYSQTLCQSGTYTKQKQNHKSLRLQIDNTWRSLRGMNTFAKPFYHNSPTCNSGTAIHNILHLQPWIHYHFSTNAGSAARTEKSSRHIQRRLKVMTCPVSDTLNDVSFLKASVPRALLVHQKFVFFFQSQPEPTCRAQCERGVGHSGSNSSSGRGNGSGTLRSRQSQDCKRSREGRPESSTPAVATLKPKKINTRQGEE